MRRFNTLKTIFGFSCILLAATIAQAQFRAGVQGTVTDAGGGTIAGATVTLTNTETNKSQSMQTSADGFYRFAELPPGVYTLTVEQTGFKKRVISSVNVLAESVKGQDVVLEAGNIAETVTVTAEETPLDTEDPNIRRTIRT